MKGSVLHMTASAMWSHNHQWFINSLSASKRSVLLIDYDGTLAPFSPERRRARPYPDIPELLKKIMETGGTRLIIVSGRGAREVPRLLGLRSAPEVWGSHGVERLHPDGRYEEVNVDDDAVHALAEAELRLDREGLGPYIEVKLAGIAVHWRALPPADVLRIRTRAYRVLENVASRGDLMLGAFEEGVELRLRSASKGEAVRRLLEQVSVDTPVAYVGDDVDDEDAFRTLNGRGLTVLVRSKVTFTAAQVVLRPPDELAGFLKEWIRACGGKA